MVPECPSLVKQWQIDEQVKPSQLSLQHCAPPLLSSQSILNRRLPRPALAAAVLLIVMGCVVAGAGDLAFDPYGYAVALTCAVLQVRYLCGSSLLALSSLQLNPAWLGSWE